MSFAYSSCYSTAHLPVSIFLFIAQMPSRKYTSNSSTPHRAIVAIKYKPHVLILMDHKLSFPVYAHSWHEAIAH